MRPLVRGYIHQIAFFIALVAAGVLISKSHGDPMLFSNIIYGFTLVALYSVSGLYHGKTWSRQIYRFMKSLDHAVIFAFIAGSATPICVLGIRGEVGLKLLLIIWTFAIAGMLMSIFWVHSPKWARAALYVLVGWLAVPYLPEIKNSLGSQSMALLLAGGILYTVGALIYAFKWPNPYPKIFGYHEIFHLFVVVASACQFWVIYSLV